MKDHVGELNTEKKIKKFDPKIKVALFDDEEELTSKKPNFGEKVSEGKWQLKKSFKKRGKTEHHVIEKSGHYHPPTGVWFSKDKPETVHGAREKLFKFLG